MPTAKLQFIRQLRNLRTVTAVHTALAELLTAKEIAELERRWQAIQLLRRGATYQTITVTTGLSSATIARIAKQLRIKKA